MRALLLISLLIGIQSCRKDELKKNSIVMLGDSMTRMGDWSGLMGTAVTNLGEDGIKSGELLNEILPKALEESPEFIYLMIGINNATDQTFSLDHYKADLTAICDTLEANHINFAIQSVLPTTIYFIEAVGATITKENVDQINAFLIEFCAARDIPFIDLRGALTTGNGYLNPDYSIDGVHLNAAGYKLWAECLR